MNLEKIFCAHIGNYTLLNQKDYLFQIHLLDNLIVSFQLIRKCISFYIVYIEHTICSDYRIPVLSYQFIKTMPYKVSIWTLFRAVHPEPSKLVKSLSFPSQTRTNIVYRQTESYIEEPKEISSIGAVNVIRIKLQKEL